MFGNKTIYDLFHFPFNISNIYTSKNGLGLIGRAVPGLILFSVCISAIDQIQNDCTHGGEW